MKKILTILIISLTLIGCSKDNNLSSLETVLEKKSMIVGFTNYPPLGYKDETGEITGLDIEIAKAVAKELGVDVTFQYIDWDNKTFELNNGNIDMIWNGFTITDEREKEVLFSKPYMDNQIVIISLKSNPIDKISDLTDLNVAVETQSSGQLSIEKNDIVNSINELQKYTNVSDAVLALNSGSTDAVIADVTFAGYLQTEHPDMYHVSDEFFESEYYGIGFRIKDDSTLKDEIDRIIDGMIEDGRASEISIKWLGKDLINRP